MLKKTGFGVSAMVLAVSALALPSSVQATDNANQASAGFLQSKNSGDKRILTWEDYQSHASSLFERADFDKDVTLSSDEYSSLKLVMAQLARVNGYLSIETQGSVLSLQVPDDVTQGDRAKSDDAKTDDAKTDDYGPFMGFSRAERLRIDAVARQQYYGQAGEDGAMDRAEFLDAASSEFALADRNGDDRLINGELTSLARTLSLTSSGETGSNS